MKTVNSIACRIICFLISAIIMLSFTFGAEATGPHPFSDVQDGSWYKSSVIYVYENSLMNGTAGDLFSPDLNMSRAMLVTVLHRYAGTPAASDHPFTDVEIGFWYDAAVAWAYENGIVNGTSSTTFSPYEDVTREQMVAIFYRFAAYLCLEKDCDADMNNYADASQISQYAQDPFKWAISAEIVNGVGNDRLAPKGNATRAQCAAVIERFIRWTGKDAVIDLTALEQYGRDYAYSIYGFDGNPNCSPDTGASYYPGYKVSFTTAEEAKGYIREKIDNLYESLCYYGYPIVKEMEDGRIARWKLNIYIEPSDKENVYNIWCYYGGDADPYHQDYWKHVHKYSTETVEATCGHAGGTLYTCDCGDFYIADPVPALEHDFYEWEVYIEPGYALHNFSDLVEISGTIIKRCKNCTYSIEKEITHEQWNSGGSNMSAYNRENIDLDIYQKNVDPRIEIIVDLNGFRDDSYRYKHLTVTDTRGWGDPPSISINDEDCFEISYFKADGIKVSLTLYPCEGYVSRCVLLEDGSYNTHLIGDFKD